MRTQIAASTDVCDSGHNTKLLDCVWECQNICRNLGKQHPTQCAHAHTRIHVPLVKLLGLTFIPNLTLIVKPMHIEIISETSLAMSSPKLHSEVPE